MTKESLIRSIHAWSVFVFQLNGLASFIFRLWSNILCLYGGLFFKSWWCRRSEKILRHSEWFWHCLNLESGRTRFMPNFDIVGTRLLKVAFMGSIRNCRMYFETMLSRVTTIHVWLYNDSKRNNSKNDRNNSNNITNLWTGYRLHLNNICCYQHVSCKISGCYWSIFTVMFLLFVVKWLGKG